MVFFKEIIMAEKESFNSLEDQLRMKGVKVVNGPVGAKKSQKTRPVVGTEPEKKQEPARKPFNFSSLKAPALKGEGRIIPSGEEMKSLLDQLNVFKVDVVPYMHDLMGQWWDAFMVPSELFDSIAEARALLDENILTVLDSNEPYRTPGRVAWADALIKKAPDPFRNRGVIDTVVNLLFKERFLIVGVGEGFKHEGKMYVLSDNLVSRDDARAVIGSLQRLRARGQESKKEEFRTELDQLRSLAGDQLSFDEFRAGKEGFVILDVPDKASPDGRFFTGGPVLVQSSGGRVRIIDAAGPIKRRAISLNDTGASVALDQLWSEKIDFGGPVRNARDQIGIHEIVRRFILKKEENSRRAEETTKRKEEEATVWEQEKGRFQEQVSTEEEQLVSKANLNADEFFAGNDGSFVLKFPKPFTDIRNKRVMWFVMCLVKRHGDGQIQMLECPERLKEFFGEDVLTPLEPGRRFESIPYPLGYLLSAGLTHFENKQKEVLAE